MAIYSKVLVTLVALEFLYIMYLETWATTSKKTSKVFNMEPSELNGKSVKILFKNQGIYNGLIAIALLYATFFSSSGKEISILFLIYIILVAIYGGISSDIKIIFKQGGLAIIALISLLI